MTQGQQPEKKGGFLNFFSRLFTKPVESMEEIAEKTVDGVADMAGKAVGTVGDTAMAVTDMAGKAVGTVGDTAMAVGGMAGKAVGTVGGVISSGIETLTKSLVNTSKFLTDSEYREKEGYPWLQSILRDNWRKVSQEITESQEMLLVLWKYSRGYELSEDEKTAAKEQLFDLMKVVPALAIFALPGGAILLPLVARALPWDLMPSSFRQKVKEEYGEDALAQELKDGEEIPLDKEAIVPEEVQQKALENIQELVGQQEEKIDREAVVSEDVQKKALENTQERGEG